MKFRALFTALLCAALAAPAVVAQVGGFPDVPEDHPRADAVRWAAQEELFLGFPDGNLRPDEELTRTQFVKVAERLYDSADAWTRADWAQVMYAGRPSLTGGAAATTSTTGGGGPSVTGAPAGDVSLRCGWPLGEAEPVDPDSKYFSRIYPDIRFPVTPCEPPVTYRIEFQNQTLNLPYAAEGASWTPALSWTEGGLGFGIVKVTEFRPGGPVSGRVLGEVRFMKTAVTGRTPTYPTETIPPTTAPPPTAPPTTAAVTTTTAAPPRTTATVPPPPRVEEVPLDERDVAIHWFLHPGSDEKGDVPLFAMYVADPGGPMPLPDSNGRTPWNGFSPLVNIFTESGEGDTSGAGHGLSIYSPTSRNAAAAFGVAVRQVPADTVGAEVSAPPAPGAAPGTPGAKGHPFGTVNFTRVEPPAPGCVPYWRASIGGGNRVAAVPDCHPAEWARWWGVRATVPAS